MRAAFKNARRAKEKSQRAMSVDLDLSVSYIRHLEAGRLKPRFETAVKISQYLNEPVGVLFEGEFDREALSSLSSIPTSLV